MNLTYFPSLNSPYTHISTQRVQEMANNPSVNLITKPVLPMLMRGMTIPTYKGKYIISDAAREGRKYNHEIKSIYSPIGSPARKAYSLFPSIDKAGKGFEYITELLNASFQDGINIGDDDYLQNLVCKLGLEWDEIKKTFKSNSWKKDLDRQLDRKCMRVIVGEYRVLKLQMKMGLILFMPGGKIECGLLKKKSINA